MTESESLPFEAVDEEKAFRPGTEDAPEGAAGAYSAAQIQVLEGLEAVRRRPGMYIGSTDDRGLHHLVHEIVDNSVDEALASFCTRIDIAILADGSVRVSDDGRGIPVDMHPTHHVPALDLIFTKLHAGGKFGGGGYKVSGGLHGVGASVVNALSRWLEVEVHRDGSAYRRRYERGDAVGELVRIGASTRRGTSVTFMPDETIFTTVEFQFQTLAERFREMAYLTAGLRFSFVDERPDRRTDEANFWFQGGISSFVRYLNRKYKTLHETVIHVVRTMPTAIAPVSVEVAVQYREDADETVYAFANTIKTPDGGEHLHGFHRALSRVISDYAEKNQMRKPSDPPIKGEDVRRGLSAIVSVKLQDPQFEGQTKAKLGNSEVRGAVEIAFGNFMKDFFHENPKEARPIVEQCLMAARAREAARKVIDLVMRKGPFEGSALPGKLADCSERDPRKSELFIVEGDSAGGTAKQGRDRGFQAILPLRGKILNVEKAYDLTPDRAREVSAEVRQRALSRVVSSVELRALITALGTGIGDQFSVAKLRYHRVVIMTDADVDGSHIRTLLLTFFFRHMNELVTNGYLYVARPPLYRITVGGGRQTLDAYSDQDRDTQIRGIPRGRVEVSRYKGLGEMTATQLWDTTMNPAVRKLFQVDVQDAAAASETIEVFLGAEVAPRRRWIEAHAEEARNIDTVV